MTNEERRTEELEQRTERRHRLLPAVGVVSVLLLAALTWMVWGIMHDRQTLADRVTTACQGGGEGAAELRQVGACQQAAEQPPPLAGPIGDQGPPGDQGLTGPTGPAGPEGDPGAAGAPGLIGQTGPAGLPGEPGQPGSAGADGTAGEQGPQGEPGIDGADSIVPGPTGPQGPPGPACPSGFTDESRTVTSSDNPLVTETWWVCVATEEAP